MKTLTASMDEKLRSRSPRQEQRPSLSPRNTLIAAVVFVAAAFAVYSPVLNFQFILDDHRFLADPRLQESGHLWEYFTSYAWSQVAGGPLSFFRPLFVLWMRLNVVLNGASSWGWHLLSIAKHVFVAVLLGLLVWKLLRDRVAALLAATLFALHPAQTESVAWVTVPDPLMAAAILGTVLLCLNGERETLIVPPAREKARNKKRKSIQAKTRTFALFSTLAAVATCFAALLAKETAMVLPAIIFAFFFVEARREAEPESSGTQNAILRLLLAFRRTLPFLAAAALYFLLRISALNGHFSPQTQHLPLTTVLLSIPATLWFYVKALCWPLRSHAFADPALADSFSVHGVLVPALGVSVTLAVLAFASIWAWRKAAREFGVKEASNIQRSLLLGSLLLLVPILPTLNLNILNPGDFLHGRYVYLPLAGMMMILATIFHLWGHKSRIALLGASGIMACGFALLTVQQEGMWKDDLTVFTVAHELAPHNEPVAHSLSSAHVQIALALDESDRCDEAIPIFEQAIQQYPSDWFAWAGLGECRFKQNDFAGAEQSLHRASDLSHEPRVTQEWQAIRDRMGMPRATFSNR